MADEIHPYQRQFVRLTIEESALCTIPNHPLSVGQTRIDGVEEPRGWLLYRPDYLLIHTEGDEIASAMAVDMSGRIAATTENSENGMALLGSYIAEPECMWRWCG